MSSTFDDASLVFIPSGYKTSKAYSVKPSDGSGDLTFSRSNDTATRVNSAGLIEKVRTNVALYSEDLTNAAWTKNRSTITANALANPVNGATTADYIVENTANGTHEAIQTFIVTSGVSYTVSVYAKADTRTKIALVLAGSAFASGGNGQAIFNLSTGAVISAINGATARISDAGNGWYRCSITKASIDTSGVIALQLVDASNNTSYTGDGTSRAAFFGAQLEVSDFGATPYIGPTLGSAVSVGPVANVPRLDYLNSSCPRLLLEGQRTNSQTYSEQINNAVWGLNGVTISANNATSPDGYTNADKIVETAATARHELYGSSLSFSGNNVVSFYAKYSGRRYLCALGGGGGNGATFDLLNGTVGENTAVSASIQSVGNGWYRCTVVINFTGTNQVYYILRTTASVGIDTYAGDGTSGVLFYGAQTELNASYATSYIPTLGAAVTRGADAMTLSALNNADMTFTAFLELDEPSIGGTASDWFNIRNAAVLGRAFGYSNVFGFADNYNTSALSKTKMLWKQESGTTAKIFGDGALLATNTTGTYSTPFTILEIYGANLLKPVRIKQFIFFANNITDAQCIELTTL